MDDSFEAFINQRNNKRQGRRYVLPLLCLSIIYELQAALFYSYSKEGEDSPDGTSCFFSKSDGEGTVWTSDQPGMRVENVGLNMANWFWCGFMIFSVSSFFFIYVLMKFMMQNSDCYCQEQFCVCITLVCWIVWYISGLFIRYDAGGRACSKTLLVKAGRVFDVYYIITAILFSSLFCCLAGAMIFAKLQSINDE